MAGGAVLHHLHHQGVAVAVGGDGDHALAVPTGLPLAPELPAAAAPEAGATYLFEKGMDKILKKVGEECTEVIIGGSKGDRVYSQPMNAVWGVFFPPYCVASPCNPSGIVKSYDCENFEEVAAACPVPIVVAGGKKLPEPEALHLAYDGERLRGLEFQKEEGVPLRGHSLVF